MRRKDRELTSPDDLAAVLSASCVCRIAMHGGDYPYIVPLNYGFVRDGDHFRLYLHCAHEGRKLDLLRADPRAAFEVEGLAEIIPTPGKPCGYSMAYESVVGHGRIAEVEGDEKRAGLEALMRQVAPEEIHAFPQAALDAVTILRLDIAQITGKRNRPLSHGG